MLTDNAPRTIREIQIFLASPGDVNKERDIAEKVIDEIDKTIARRRGATIRLLRWETDTYPYFHLDGPQGAIEEQITIADCDIFMCIFWQRLGTPTKKANSGTEYELMTAYDSWKKNHKPLIMLYRSLASIHPKNIDIEQIKRLNDLFNNPKIKSQWVAEYKEADNFESTIRPHLTGIIQDILDGKIFSPNVQREDDTEMLQRLDFSKEDWKPITYNMLKKYYVELPENEAILFFNGLEPSWRESISPSIARREVVHHITSELTRTNAASPHIVLLRGLGGEGKSTTLQQSLYEIVSQHPDTYILWHQQTNTPLDIKVINELAKTGYEWIIASDDADLIEKDLERVARYIRENDIDNIRFLLTTRDIDWRSVGGDKYGWLKSADFNTISIALTESDANMIVETWGYYGEQGLGRLSGKNKEVAVRELLEKARTEKKSPDNSLLGAMLQVRTGKTLQEHLKPGLERLDEIKTAGNISLKKAMAYISALHAYNIKILTPEILADVLECSEENLHEWVIKPLGAEILSGKYILIRHASIAEAIKDILKDDYEFLRISRKLLRSALKFFLKKKDRDMTKQDITDWNRLPQTIFFDKQDHDLGIVLAEEAMQSRRVGNSKYDPVTITDLAYLYEKSGQNNEAIKVFRENYAETKVDRAYYYKWSVAEGKSGCKFIAIWLSTISLADGIYEQRRDPTRIYVSLSGLSLGFKHAYEKTKEHKFLDACYACAKLGLENKPDDRAMGNLLQNLEFSKAGKSTFDPKNTLRIIIEGVNLAWSQRQEDLEEDRFGVFPENVPAPKDLKFIWLESKLKLKQK